MLGWLLGGTAVGAVIWSLAQQLYFFLWPDPFTATQDLSVNPYGLLLQDSLTQGGGAGLIMSVWILLLVRSVPLRAQAAYILRRAVGVVLISPIIGGIGAATFATLASSLYGRVFPLPLGAGPRTTLIVAFVQGSWCGWLIGFPLYILTAWRACRQSERHADALDSSAPTFQ
jgi:hypothetical protein